jgi:thiamine kinase-like enzyme
MNKSSKKMNKSAKKMNKSSKRKNMYKRKNINKKCRTKKYGGSVYGVGKDGCILDSISCGNLSKENGFVAKFLYNDKKINDELNELLKKLDPSNERYNYYYIPEEKKCSLHENFDEDYLKCSKNGKISPSNIVFEKKLENLDEKNMTKEQYRYLRTSLEKLHENNISHGDLPGNVMLHPDINMPIIIDWENAKINADDIDKYIDRNAFLDYFKVKK